MADEETGMPASPRRRRVEQTPVQRALGLLVRREHSSRELVRKLAGRGVGPDEARSAVEQLAQDGWQDDERFAQWLVRSRANGGYGPLRIRAELATHGLDRESIASAFASFDGDWTETACELVRRRFGPGGFDSPEHRRKAGELLARRGFDGDTIRRATRVDVDD